MATAASAGIFGGAAAGRRGCLDHSRHFQYHDRMVLMVLLRGCHYRTDCDRPGHLPTDSDQERPNQVWREAALDRWDCDRWRIFRLSRFHNSDLWLEFSRVGLEVIRLRGSVPSLEFVSSPQSAVSYKLIDSSESRWLN